MLKEVYQAISGTPGTSPNSKLRVFTPVMHSPYSGECLSVRQSRVVRQGSIESYILANRHSLTNNEATKWLQCDLDCYLFSMLTLALYRTTIMYTFLDICGSYHHHQCMTNSRFKVLQTTKE